MTRPHKPQVPTVGFVTPPRWTSASLVEFPALIDGPVIPQQSILDDPDFDYTLTNIATANPLTCRAAKLLGAAGCLAVAMEGTPFSWAGVETEAAARNRVDAMADAAGVPAFAAGLAVIDAVRALGLSRVALCPTYYQPDWQAAWSAFVSLCGLQVVYCRNLAQQGLTGPITSNDDHGWKMGADMVAASVRAAADAAETSGAEAVVVTGAGSRSTPIIAELEEIAGRPVIGSDGAIFHALARAAGLTLKPGALGALGGV